MPENTTDEVARERISHVAEGVERCEGSITVLSGKLDAHITASSSAHGATQLQLAAQQTTLDAIQKALNKPSLIERVLDRLEPKTLAAITALMLAIGGLLGGAGIFGSAATAHAPVVTVPVPVPVRNATDEP
jgi:hypothetical protein